MQAGDFGALMGVMEKARGYARSAKSSHLTLIDLARALADRDVRLAAARDKLDPSIEHLRVDPESPRTLEHTQTFADVRRRTIDYLMQFHSAGEINSALQGIAEDLGVQFEGSHPIGETLLNLATLTQSGALTTVLTDAGRIATRRGHHITPTTRDLCQALVDFERMHGDGPLTRLGLLDDFARL